MSVRPLVAFRVVVGLLAVTCAFAPAALAAPKNPPEPKPITFDGLVQSAEGKQFVVLVDAHKKKPKNKKNGGQPKTRTVNIQPTTKFNITAEAKPDYLRSGQMVEFQGDVESPFANRQIKELTVLATPARAGPDKGREAKAAKDAAASDPSGLTALLPKTVVARLGQSQEDNKWTVQIGRKTAEIELADDARITVVLSDARLMSAGDYVFVEAKTIPGKQGECTAETVSAKLAKPLSAKKKP